MISTLLLISPLPDNNCAFAVSVNWVVSTKAVNAKFSQTDELEADKYALGFLQSRGKKPASMLDVIYTFQNKFGSDSSFLSSHPSNQERIDSIKAQL